MIFDLPATVYSTGHPINEQVSDMLSIGFQANKLSTEQYKPGLSIVYGVLRGTGTIMKHSVASKQPYIYCDHSFFASKRSNVSYGMLNGYFRCIINGRYLNKVQPMDLPSDRSAKLNLRVHDWQTHGSKIIICPLSQYTGNYIGVNPTDWLNSTIANLKRLTDRPIEIKPKTSSVPFRTVLKDAYCVVTMDSNSAVDAVVAGVPVITSQKNAAFAMSSTFGELDNLRRPDRTAWLNLLSYQQFNHSEIVSGEAKETLNEIFV